MKARLAQFFNIALASLIALPAITVAMPTDAPYLTDKVNSYVQDQVSKDMEELNMFLCLVSAMAPDQMVNQGAYNAMVDINACKPNTQGNQQGGGGTGGGGQNNQSTSVNYISVVVEATRESNTKPMLTKIWADNLSETDNGITRTFNVRMYASATQAPSTSAPYGSFRLDFCKEYPNDTNGITTCSDHIGYISASRSGLSFFAKDNKFDPSNGEYYDEFALQLSSSSTTSKGSGIVIKTNTNSSTGLPTTNAVVFANNADYFYRNAGSNPQCFDRAESKAQESVWRYGLYNTSSGARINRESGFPIEYSTGGQTYYGYISYWGFSMPVDVPDNSPVVRPDFSTYPPTPINYTLQRTGGKLTKYTTNFKKLSDYNKLPFDFYPYNNVNDTSAGIAMSQWNNYRIFWDKDANSGSGQFFVHSYYDNILGRYVVHSTPIAVDNASMAASMTLSGSNYGLSGWSESTGSFIIKGTAFVNLPSSLSNTIVISNSQDVVYPTQFANSEFASGIVCIADCLTRSTIDSYNTAYSGGNYYATAFARPNSEYSYSTTGPTYTYTSTQHTYTLNYVSASNTGSIDDLATPYVQYYDGTSWTYPTTTPTTTPNAYTLSSMFYSLDPATGNLVDSTNSQVIQTGTNGLWGNGRFVSKADWDYILGQKCTGYPSSDCSAIITDADIDLLADDTTGHPNGYSYYQWQTGPSTWDQLTYLEDSNGSRVRLYPPLQVAYQVPNQSKYGSYKNTKLNLTYGEFGNLWGIPYNCIDMRSNTACTYAPIGTETDYWSYYRWVPQFSIPFDAANGIVFTEFNQGEIADTVGYVAKDTQFLVKGLEKEARLYKVDPSICSVQQLGTNITVDKLPSDTQWEDPVVNTGTQPTLTNTAPRVIHGVVQY